QTAVELEQALATLRSRLRRDKALADAWADVLTESGGDCARTFGDRLVVRGQPPVGHSEALELSPLAAHRDSWGTRGAAQINWWAPLFETPPERTIALYPGYFRKAVANDSPGWDFRRAVEAGRNGEDYPHLPTVAKAVPDHEALVLSLQPGDLLC